MSGRGQGQTGDPSSTVAPFVGVARSGLQKGHHERRAGGAALRFHQMSLFPHFV
jgi:hypothetical protein